MNRRAVNLGIYLPRAAKSPRDAVGLYKPEFERILLEMQNLPVAAPKGPLCIHEWYLSKPMLGYRNGECEDKFRADCIVAVGELITSYKEIELAFSLLIIILLRQKKLLTISTLRLRVPHVVQC